jgi:hypothetical protein
MKRFLVIALCVLGGAQEMSAAIISWTMSPAVAASEVSNAGSTQWAYAFNSAPGANVAVNGVTFLRVNPGGVGAPMADANALTPGFIRSGTTSYGESSNDFYQGPSVELNVLLDGLTWGGTRDFQLAGLTLGQKYLVQVFSTDDRSTQANRVLDIDSSWTTPNGSRQIENVDYTAGGSWTDPANRSKIFTGTFTADAGTQQVLAALIDPPGTGDGAGQIDLNAIQLRVVPEPMTPSLLAMLFGVLGIFRRRRSRS